MVSWRDELARLLGHKPAEELWALAEELWVERLEASKNPARDLAKFARWFQGLEAAAAMAPEPETREVRVPGDRRAWALAKILAHEAAKLPEVEAFRRDLLGGQLIGYEAVQAWILARADEDGAPTPYARVPLTEDGRVAVEGALWELPGIAFDWQEIDYPTPENVVQRVRVCVRAGGTLARLNAIVKQLAKVNTWKEAHAVVFVLTGGTPPLYQALVSVTPRWLPYPALSTIKMELSPRLNPSDVARLYQEARTGKSFGPAAKALHAGGVLPKRVKPISDESCELAVFVAQANDGRRWEDGLAEWNRGHPDAKRESLEGFIRAAREAYKRVTGQPLDWQRERGQRGSKRPRGRT